MPADLVLTGGVVYTVDAARRRARAVAVRGARIVAVGTEADMLPLTGPRTEVINLDGAMVLPGFHDAHAHPVNGGIARLRCDLSKAGRPGPATQARYAEIVAGYAAENPAARWILGGGWSMPAFENGRPAATALDAIVSDRPAFLTNRDLHSAWVNSKALALAGIDAATPDPADGRIERDAAGNPSGALHDGAMDLVRKHLPTPTAADMADGLRGALRYLHSLGITGWQDAAVDSAHLGTPGSSRLYSDFARRGELTARVAGALWWDRHRGDEQIEELIATRAATSHGNFQAGTVKIMLDGVCETFTAAMLEPYLDSHGRHTGNKGISFIEPQDLKRYVTALDAAGFGVHIHALADRAVREALDAIEAARRANGWTDNRHHLAHLQLIHPNDLPRFRELGVTANIQPRWACNERQMTELTIPFIGTERAALQYPFGDLDRLGTNIAFGSDWPVSTPDPFAEMHVAVNRAAAWTDQQPFLPAQRLTIASAIHAFTMGAAYVSCLDAVAGSIEPGKQADLIVVDRDLFAAGPEHLAEAKVDRTFTAGKLVYQKG